MRRPTYCPTEIFARLVFLAMLLLAIGPLHAEAVDSAAAWLSKNCPGSSDIKRPTVEPLKLDTRSIPHLKRSTKERRSFLEKSVFGHFDLPRSAPNEQSTLIEKDENSPADQFQIVLDLYPGLKIRGRLLLPEGLKPDERRPAIVCVGNPTDSPTALLDYNNQTYNGLPWALQQRGLSFSYPNRLGTQKNRTSHFKNGWPRVERQFTPWKSPFIVRLSIGSPGVGKSTLIESAYMESTPVQNRPLESDP